MTGELRDIAAVTLRKVTLRLIPFLFVLYIVAWLDRVNVGFAALQMNSANREQRSGRRRDPGCD